MDNPVITRVEKKDGAYRWKYELSLFKDLSILWLTAKVLLITAAATCVLMGLITGIADGDLKVGLLFGLRLGGIMLAVFAGLLLIGYPIYAAIMGGKYRMEFTMDDEKVVHAQAPEQGEKAKKIAAATAVAGALANRPSIAGAGLNSQRTEMETYFSEIKKVKVRRKSNYIDLIGIGQNRLYVPEEDFDMVAGFIKDHAGKDVVWTE